MPIEVVIKKDEKAVYKQRLICEYIAKHQDDVDFDDDVDVDAIISAVHPVNGVLDADKSESYQIRDVAEIKMYKTSYSKYSNQSNGTPVEHKNNKKDLHEDIVVQSNFQMDSQLRKKRTLVDGGVDRNLLLVAPAKATIDGMEETNTMNEASSALVNAAHRQLDETRLNARLLAARRSNMHTHKKDLNNIEAQRKALINASNHRRYAAKIDSSSTLSKSLQPHDADATLDWALKATNFHQDTIKLDLFKLEAQYHSEKEKKAAIAAAAKATAMGKGVRPSVGKSDRAQSYRESKQVNISKNAPGVNFIERLVCGLDALNKTLKEDWERKQVARDYIEQFRSSARRLGRQQSTLPPVVQGMADTSSSREDRGFSTTGSPLKNSEVAATAVTPKFSTVIHEEEVMLRKRNSNFEAALRASAPLQRLSRIEQHRQSKVQCQRSSGPDESELHVGRIDSLEGQHEHIYKGGDFATNDDVVPEDNEISVSSGVASVFSDGNGSESESESESSEFGSDEDAGSVGSSGEGGNGDDDNNDNDKHNDSRARDSSMSVSAFNQADREYEELMGEPTPCPHLPHHHHHQVHHHHHLHQHHHHHHHGHHHNNTNNDHDAMLLQDPKGHGSRTKKRRKKKAYTIEKALKALELLNDLIEQFREGEKLDHASRESAQSEATFHVNRIRKMRLAAECFDEGTRAAAASSYPSDDPAASVLDTAAPSFRSTVATRHKANEVSHYLASVEAKEAADAYATQHLGKPPKTPNKPPVPSFSSPRRNNATFTPCGRATSTPPPPATTTTTTTVASGANKAERDAYISRNSRNSNNSNNSNNNNNTLSGGVEVSFRSPRSKAVHYAPTSVPFSAAAAAASASASASATTNSTAVPPPPPRSLGGQPSSFSHPTKQKVKNEGHFDINPYSQHHHFESETRLYFASPVGAINTKSGYSGVMTHVPAQPYREREREQKALKTRMQDLKQVNASKMYSLNEILQSLYNLTDVGLTNEMIERDRSTATEVVIAKKVTKAIQADVKFLADLCNKVATKSVKGSNSLVNNTWRAYSDDQKFLMKKSLFVLEEHLFNLPTHLKQRLDQFLKLDKKQMDLLKKTVPPSSPRRPTCGQKTVVLSGTAGVDAKNEGASQEQRSSEQSVGATESKEEVGMGDAERLQQQKEQQQQQQPTQEVYSSPFLTEVVSSSVSGSTVLATASSATATAFTTTNTTTNANAYAESIPSTDILTKPSSMVRIASPISLRQNQKESNVIISSRKPSSRNQHHTKPSVLSGDSSFISSTAIDSMNNDNSNSTNIASTGTYSSASFHGLSRKPHRGEPIQLENDFKHLRNYNHQLNVQLRRNTVTDAKAVQKILLTTPWFISLIVRLKKYSKNNQLKDVPENIFKLLASLKKLLSMHLELTADLVWKTIMRSFETHEFRLNFVYNVVQHVCDAVNIDCIAVHSKLKAGGIAQMAPKLLLNVRRARKVAALRSKISKAAEQATAKKKWKTGRNNNMNMLAMYTVKEDESAATAGTTHTVPATAASGAGTNATTTCVSVYGGLTNDNDNDSHLDFQKVPRSPAVEPTSTLSPRSAKQQQQLQQQQLQQQHTVYRKSSKSNMGSTGSPRRASVSGDLNLLQQKQQKQQKQLESDNCNIDHLLDRAPTLSLNDYNNSSSYKKSAVSAPGRRGSVALHFNAAFVGGPAPVSVTAPLTSPAPGRKSSRVAADGGSDKKTIINNLTENTCPTHTFTNNHNISTKNTNSDNAIDHLEKTGKSQDVRLSLLERTDSMSSLDSSKDSFYDDISVDLSDMPDGMTDEGDFDLDVFDEKEWMMSNKY